MGEGSCLEDTCTWKVTSRIGVLTRRLSTRVQEEEEGNSSEREMDQDQKWTLAGERAHCVKAIGVQAG